MKSVIIIALMAALAIESVKGQSGNVLWTKDYIKEINGGEAPKDCFSATKDQNGDFFATSTHDYEHGFADVLTLEIRDGFFCVFEFDVPFVVTQISPDPYRDAQGNNYSTSDENYGLGIKGYWFKYEGYGPSIYSGNETCEFVPERQDELFANHELTKNSVNTWFIPNLLGGACKYYVLLGCLLDHDFDGETHNCKVTLIKKYNDSPLEVEGGHALTLIKSIAALSLLFVSQSVL